MTDEVDEFQERFDLLLNRLETSYDGIGHSSGRPFLYFVYKLGKEPMIERLMKQQMQTHATLGFYCIDMLKITMDSLRGQEELRRQLLDDPLESEGQVRDILDLWAEELSETITRVLEVAEERKRPVVVLFNLSALHPLGNPTSLMEYLAQREPRDPRSGAMVPIVVLIPGSHPPQSSRFYLFLDQILLDFYRGEEI